MQPEAEDSVSWSFVTHKGWSSGGFYLRRIGLTSGSFFYGKMNTTWPAFSGRVEV